MVRGYNGSDPSTLTWWTRWIHSNQTRIAGWGRVGVVAFSSSSLLFTTEVAITSVLKKLCRVRMMSQDAQSKACISAQAGMQKTRDVLNDVMPRRVL